VEWNNTRVPVAEVHASKENIVIMVHLIIAESGRQEGSEEGTGVSNKVCLGYAVGFSATLNNIMVWFSDMRHVHTTNLNYSFEV
jgi:hypothetical protein